MNGFRSALTPGCSARCAQVFLWGFPGCAPRRGDGSSRVRSGWQLRCCRVPCHPPAPAVGLQWANLEEVGYMLWKINLLPKSVLDVFWVCLLACFWKAVELVNSYFENE